MSVMASNAPLTSLTVSATASTATTCSANNTLITSHTAPLLVHVSAESNDSGASHQTCNLATSASTSTTSTSPSAISPIRMDRMHRPIMLQSKKKHRLLKRCHRYFKPLLRNLNSAHRGSSSSTTNVMCQTADDCLSGHCCENNNNHMLSDLQNKYSELSAEVASLRRQLLGVQQAFTSLRTMLLASLTSSANSRSAMIVASSAYDPTSDAVDAPSLTDVSSVQTTLISAVDSQITTPHPMPDSDLLIPPNQRVGVCNESPTTIPTTASTKTQITSTLWYPSVIGGPATSSISSASSTSSNHSSPPFTDAPAANADCAPTDTPTLTVHYAHQPMPDNCPTKLESSMEPLHNVPDIIEENDPEPQPVQRPIDPFKLAVAARNEMVRLNVSQRILCRQLDGMSLRTVSELLRRPRPWVRLPLRIRKAYEQLRDWLARVRDTKVESNIATQSIPSDTASPWIICETEEAAASEHILEDLCSQSDHAVFISPFEVSASPNSISSLPTVDSGLHMERHHTNELLVRTHVVEQIAVPSSCGPPSSSESEPPMDVTGCSTSVAQDQRRQYYPSPLDVETQKRISDILSAARLAMAREKSSDGEGDRKRKKRGFGLEPGGLYKLAPKTEESESWFTPEDEQSTQLNQMDLTDYHSTQEREPSHPTSSASSVTPAITGMAATIGNSQLPQCGLPEIRQTIVPNPPNSGSTPAAAVAAALSYVPTSLSGLPSNEVPTISLVTHQGNRVTLPITAFQFNSTSANSGPAAQSTAANPPLLSNPQAPTPAVIAPLAPLLASAGSTLQGSMLMVTPMAAPSPTPAVPSPTMPTLLPAPGVAHSSSTTQQSQHLPSLSQQQPAQTVVNSLQQTLLLLAAAARVRANNSALTPNDPSVTGLESRLSESVSSVTSLPQDPVSSGPSLPVQVDEPSQSESAVDSTDSGPRPSDTSIQKMLSAVTQMKGLSESLPPLDAFDLATRAKQLLREQNISQRLFGEVVLDMSQAAVSDILNKPRPWESLNAKLKLAYWRLYTWFQQPDRMKAVRAAQLIQRPRLRYYLSENHPDSQSNPDLNEQYTLTTGDEFVAGQRKRDASDSLTGLNGTPNHKLMRCETDGGDTSSLSATLEGDALLDEDRRSLFDIARAATAAMQRANSFSGSMKLGRARGCYNPSAATAELSPIRPIISSNNNNTTGTTIPSWSIAPTTCATPSDGQKLSPMRYRVVFTPIQKDTLVAAFKRQPYPHADKLREIANDLDLTYKTVLNWFHNRRVRSRPPYSMPLDRDSSLNNHLMGTTTVSSSSSTAVMPTILTSSSHANILSSPPMRAIIPAPSNSTDGSSTDVKQDSERMSQSMPLTCINGAEGGPLFSQNRRKRPDPARLIAPCL